MSLDDGYCEADFKQVNDFFLRTPFKWFIDKYTYLMTNYRDKR